MANGFTRAILGLMAVFAVSSCVHNDKEVENSQVSSLETIYNYPDVTTESHPDIIDKKMKMTSNMSINVFKDGSPVGYILQTTENEKEALRVFLYREGDKSSISDSVDLYLLEDGVLIPFSINNGEDGIFNSVALEPGEEKWIDISCKVSTDFHVLTLICRDYNDILMDANVAYSMFNSSGKVKDYPEKSNHMEYMVQMEEKGIFELGFSSNMVDSKKTVGCWLYLPPDYDDASPAPIMVDDKNNAYLIFSLDSDYPFYLMLFCDGKPIKVIDDSYSIFVDTQNSEMAFQFPLRDVLKEGRHNYSVLVTPAEIIDDAESQIKFYGHKIPIERIGTDRI